MFHMSGPARLWAVSLLETLNWLIWVEDNLRNGEKTDSALQSKDHPPPEMDASEVYVPGNAPL